MKNNIGILIIVLIVILSITACTQNLESTDLSNVKVDDIKLDESISDIDLTKYTKSDRFLEKKNGYNFEEIRIVTDDNSILTQVNANISDINLYVNNNNKFSKLEDIVNVLGENYKNYWYDKEQQLKSNQYIDSKSRIKADFVYNIYENKLVWVILNKY